MARIILHFSTKYLLTRVSETGEKVAMAPAARRQGGKGGWRWQHPGNYPVNVARSDRVSASGGRDTLHLVIDAGGASVAQLSPTPSHEPPGASWGLHEAAAVGESRSGNPCSLVVRFLTRFLQSFHTHALGVLRRKHAKRPSKYNREK